MRRSVREVEVVDISELDQQVVCATAVVLEVDRLKAFGHDVRELPLGGPGGVGVEEAGGVGGGSPCVRRPRECGHRGSYCDREFNCS